MKKMLNWASWEHYKKYPEALVVFSNSGFDKAGKESLKIQSR